METTSLIEAHLDQGRPVIALDGTLVGATYYDGNTHRWYAADPAQLGKLADIAADGEGEVYSRWCSVTSASEHETEADARIELLGVPDDETIEQLRIEAGAAGDDRMIDACNAALDGNATARLIVAKALDEARARAS